MKKMFRKLLVVMTTLVCMVGLIVSGPACTLAWSDQRFTDNGDGTVTDILTELVWLKNANCFKEKNWADAMAAATDLAEGKCALTDGSEAGDWRLPTRRELFSLIDANTFNPALPFGHPFTGVQLDNYWSSTSYAPNPDGAWYVYIYYGGVYHFYKTSSKHVWPVRDRQ